LLSIFRDDVNVAHFVLDDPSGFGYTSDVINVQDLSERRRSVT
jgi:hypothetical protein